MLARTDPLKGVSARTFAARDLTDADADAWYALCAQHEFYDSALLKPAFAKSIGEARNDAEVTFIEREGRLIAVLAYHRRPGAFGRPLGIPFSDYSSPIVTETTNLTLGEIISLAGLSAWRSDTLVDPWQTLVDPAIPSNESHVIRLKVDESPEDYLEARRALHAKRFKNFRRLERQLIGEGSDLQLKWGKPTPETMAPIIERKSEQFLQSGLVDLTQTDQSRKILDQISQSGFVTSLWWDDDLIAGHFGFRDGVAFHPWIASYNPDYAAYSPGNIFLKHIILSMPEMGIECYDLAGGHDHYKKYFANSSRPSYPAAVTCGGFNGQVQKLSQTVWSKLGSNREGSAVGRLQRRLDHIAVSESRTIPRLREVARAVRKRGFSRPTSNPHDQG